MMSNIKAANKAETSVIKQSETSNAALNTVLNTVSTDSVNSWSTTVSQYLLHRRKQTQTAYQGQLIPTPHEGHSYDHGNHSNYDSQGGLFEALFEVLVQRLEEGHTVLILEASTTDSNMVNDNNTGLNLFAWQQQLLQPLMQPLWNVLISADMANISLDELLSSDEVWQSAMRQSTLPSYDKQILEQRRKAGATLYHLLKQLAEHSISIENSLSEFNQLLKENPLFNNNEMQESKKDSPIIFQTSSSLANNTTKITLWLHRTWQAEHALASHVIRIKNQVLSELPITLNPDLNPEQQAAINMANHSAFSIITGGPGTGKTFTVAQLVMALQLHQAKTTVEGVNSKSKANLALAAPTGKAAQRMQESLQAAIQHAGVSMKLPEAKTIHRLLGIGQGGQPRYTANNPLSEDIIIVDEASMLGVELANHLVSAIKPNARLILLGDANQLAAVDAGAVLADLCRIASLQDVHQRLADSRRFKEDSGIGKLAKLINQPEENIDNSGMASVWQLLQEDDALAFYHLTSAVRSDEVVESKDYNQNDKNKNSLSNYKFLNKLSKKYSEYFNQTKKTLTKTKLAKSMPNSTPIEDFNALIKTLNQFRILTAGHHGRCGDHHINSYLSEQHKSILKSPLSKSPWYHGRPIMVLQNNYELGLFNGDIGICLQTERGRLQVFFENKKQGINTNMLSDEMIATAYAMTIHKSQGSEFDHVAISFDDNNARLLSQELIYTAVTRAKQQVSIFSTETALTKALSTPTMRQTGLSLQFSDFVNK